MASKREPPDQRIVFFDGLCHLCDGFVDYLVLHDPQHRLHFAPLQGETARRFLSEQERTTGSLLFLEHGKVFSHSTAVLRSVSLLGGVFSFAKILFLVPRFIRDFFYNWVARNRYVWFGERESCRLPTPEEKEFLLP